MTNLTLKHAMHCAVLAMIAAGSAAAQPVLQPGAAISIPASPGKFDFLAVDAAAHRLLAGHEKDETADFFDLSTNQLIARVKVGPAVGVTVDPKTGRYFASVQDDKRIAIIDGKTFKETGSIALPGESDAILFDAKDRRIYITNDNGSFLWAVDPDTGKVAAAIPIPGEPECMAHDPAADRIYLNIKNHDEVAVIDTKTNSVIATWPAAPAVGPHGLVLDVVHSRLYVSGDNGQLVAIDTKTGKNVAATTIVEHVDQIAFDPGLRRIYCAGPDWMSVVQASDSSLSTPGKIATATTAKNVAVDLQTHTVWTTFTDGKDSFAKSWKQE